MWKTHVVEKARRLRTVLVVLFVGVATHGRKSSAHWPHRLFDSFYNSIFPSSCSKCVPSLMPRSSVIATSRSRLLAQHAFPLAAAEHVAGNRTDEGVKDEGNLEEFPVYNTSGGDTVG